MKLYTRETIIKGFAKYSEMSEINSMNIVDILTPIELPSDEEIEHKSIDISSITSNYARTVSKRYYKAGAKWMKEQILNQNK